MVVFSGRLNKYMILLGGEVLSVALLVGYVPIASPPFDLYKIFASMTLPSSKREVELI